LQIEVETGVEITALQLYTCSHSVAAFLANRHFARGDVACVVLANCWQYVAFFLGCANVGVTVSGASFLFTDCMIDRNDYKAF
jgi:acyl-CoA synthetase (AMP-forming)/AMP-acid ligase II